MSQFLRECSLALDTDIKFSNREEGGRAGCPLDSAGRSATEMSLTHKGNPHLFPGSHPCANAGKFQASGVTSLTQGSIPRGGPTALSLQTPRQL